MNVNINLLGLSLLMLIFLTLIIISHPRRPSLRKSSEKERRNYPRYKISLRVKYKTALEEGISWIRDISESGARLFLHRTLKTLKIGESVEIEINLPYDAQSIFVKGDIVWSEGNDAGFSFSEVPQGDVNRIIKYIEGDKYEGIKNKA